MVVFIITVRERKVKKGLRDECAVWSVQCAVKMWNLECGMWNCNVYGWHSQSVKRVDNAWESSIMSSETSKAVKDDVYYIGKLDKSIYKCVTEDIKGSLNSIKKYLPKSYEVFCKMVKEIIL